MNLRSWSAARWLGAAAIVFLGLALTLSAQSPHSQAKLIAWALTIIFAVAASAIAVLAFAKKRGPDNTVPPALPPAAPAPPPVPPAGGLRIVSEHLMNTETGQILGKTVDVDSTRVDNAGLIESSEERDEPSGL